MILNTCQLIDFKYNISKLTLPGIMHTQFARPTKCTTATRVHFISIATYYFRKNVYARARAHTKRSQGNIRTLGGVVQK